MVRAAAFRSHLALTVGGMDWKCDSEHRSTYHLLSQAPAIARKFSEAEHITDDDGIEWGALEAQCSSTTERLLVRVARDLWKGSGDAPLGRLLVSLDEMNFEALIEAMRLRREWTSPADARCHGDRHLIEVDAEAMTGEVGAVALQVQDDTCALLSVVCEMHDLDGQAAERSTATLTLDAHELYQLATAIAGVRSELAERRLPKLRRA